MQNIHQFASNLTLLLMCLKLTLICCEDVPLIRNSLNSRLQIALAEHDRIPGDATPHSYCTSTPIVRKLKLYLLQHALKKQTSKLLCPCLVCLPSQGQESQTCILMMEMIGYHMHCICLRARSNQCKDENKLARQNVWQLTAIESMHTHSHRTIPSYALKTVFREVIQGNTSAMSAHFFPVFVIQTWKTKSQ